MNVFDIGCLVLWFATVCEATPMHVRVPLAAFNKKIDPLGPLAEILEEYFYR
jgi:hypothetical protein